MVWPRPERPLKRQTGYFLRNRLRLRGSAGGGDLARTPINMTLLDNSTHLAAHRGLAWGLRNQASI
jgi:hypothetical protein